MSENTLLSRLYRTLGPLAGGMILDGIDLVTFGPLGIYGGFLVGGAAAWWITSIYRLELAARVGMVALAMLYVALPFTALLPVATVTAALLRLDPELERTNADTPAPIDRVGPVDTGERAESIGNGAAAPPSSSPGDERENPAGS